MVSGLGTRYGWGNPIHEQNVAKGFKLKGLNDAEKAKLIYLMHHKGEGNGPLFIRNELHLMPKKKISVGGGAIAEYF